MSNKKKHFNFLSIFRSIRLAILIPFTLLLTVTLLIALVITLSYTEKEVLENSTDYTTRLIKQVHRDVDSYLTYMENISILVSRNPEVRSYMSERGNAPEDTELYNNIVLQLNTVLDTRRDISNIGILAPDGRYIINDGECRMNSHIQWAKMDWYQKIYAGNQKYLTSSHVQNIIENRYSWVVTMSRAIYDSVNENVLGIFFIDLNYDAIRNLCESNNLGKDGYVFIMDLNGNIIYHPNQQLLYNDLKTECIDKILACDEDHFTTTDEKGNKILYAISKSDTYDWMVVGAVNTSELTKNKEQTQRLYWMIFVLLLSIAILISFGLSAAITKPIKRLSNSMKRAQEGQLERALVEVHDEAELGSLAETFNGMIVTIEQLMKQNSYEQKQKRISELKALQAQINPHFLYNTLDSIIWMAEDGQTDDVVLMTSSLAKLLRQSISNEKEFVTIREEIDYIRHYLIIQKMRYKDKLTYEINIDPDIQFCDILKLVVQPLVENAIYHGIKYKDGIGFIQVVGYRINEDICLEVIDNGAGITPEKLEHLFEPNCSHPKKNGVGIINVQERLRMQYGEPYGLYYESRPSEGTRVKILIPYIQADRR